VGLHLAILHAGARAHRRRHGNARPQRRARPIYPNHRAELNYRAGLLRLVAKCRALVDEYLDSLRHRWPRPSEDSAPQLAADASFLPPGVGGELDRLAAKLGNLDAMAKQLAGLAVEANRDSVDERLAREINRVVGVDIKGMLATNGQLLQAMQEAARDNVALIRSIPEQYLDRVHSTVTDGWSNGVRWESLVEQIQRDGDITEVRAKLIARDQTAKMNSSFNEIQQQSVGVDEYEWSTSADERVRDSHAAMEGKRCRWDEPPIVDDEPVHPGEAINCRCVAIPVIDMEAGASIDLGQEAA
jgi:SPP1 gp7 family putative phage head morphogenesis protein